MTWSAEVMGTQGPTGHLAAEPEENGRTLGQLRAFTNGWACSEPKPSSQIHSVTLEARAGHEFCFYLNKKDPRFHFDTSGS